MDNAPYKCPYDDDDADADDADDDDDDYYYTGSGIHTTVHRLCEFRAWLLSHLRTHNSSLRRQHRKWLTSVSSRSLQ